MHDDIFLNKQAIIERCLLRIKEEYAQAKDTLEIDYTRQDAIILNIQRACEASIDLAMHIIKKNQLGLPQTSRQAFELLKEANIIPTEISARMQAMVGFRNIAVHQYQELSLPILRAVLDNHLDDFGDFIRYLKDAGSSAYGQR